MFKGKTCFYFDFTSVNLYTGKGSDFNTISVFVQKCSKQTFHYKLGSIAIGFSSTNTGIFFSVLLVELKLNK